MQPPRTASRWLRLRPGVRFLVHFLQHLPWADSGEAKTSRSEDKWD